MLRRPLAARPGAAAPADERVFFVRMNNSSRAMPDEELDGYLVDRWPT